MQPVFSLSDLLSDQKPTTSFVEIPGVVGRTFGQVTLSTTLPMSRLFSIYEVDLEVQRAIIPRNLTKLMDYIQLYLNHEQPIYFPGIILSARGAGTYDAKDRMYRLNAMEKLYVVDGQHRLAAFQRLTETLQSVMTRAKDRREFERMEDIAERLRKIYEFPMSVMIYLDIDARQERQLFSDINKLPRKIGGNLAVLRDQRKFYHNLSTELVQEAEPFKRLTVDMFSERGKGEGYLFSYSLLIEVMSGLFEGRLKSGARNNGHFFSEQEYQEHYNHTVLYFEQLLKHLPPPSIEQPHLAWSENLQIAMAMFFHEEATKSANFNKYTLIHAMRILPHIPWERVYDGDEKARLPRRTRIMKAYHFIKKFYNDNHLFLIRDKEDA